MRDSLLFLHVLGVTVWVGGMFFAYMALRPAAATLLEPPQRLPLWLGVFERFFPWVWLSVIIVLGSGLGLLLRVGFAAAMPAWHLMLLLGCIMAAIYVYLFFVPYPALRRAVTAADWPAGGAVLTRIRRIIATNLSLGLITITVATLGRLV